MSDDVAFASSAGMADEVLYALDDAVVAVSIQGGDEVLGVFGSDQRAPLSLLGDALARLGSTRSAN